MNFFILIFHHIKCMTSNLVSKLTAHLKKPCCQNLTLKSCIKHFSSTVKCEYCHCYIYYSWNTLMPLKSPRLFFKYYIPKHIPRIFCLFIKRWKSYIDADLCFSIYLCPNTYKHSKDQRLQFTFYYIFYNPWKIKLDSSNALRHKTGTLTIWRTSIKIVWPLHWHEAKCILILSMFYFLLFD